MNDCKRSKDANIFRAGYLFGRLEYALHTAQAKQGQLLTGIRAPTSAAIVAHLEVARSICKRLEELGHNPEAQWEEYVKSGTLDWAYVDIETMMQTSLPYAKRAWAGEYMEAGLHRSINAGPPTLEDDDIPYAPPLTVTIDEV